MSNLVSRLRAYRDLRPEGPEAADRIEALESSLGELTTESLRDINACLIAFRDGYEPRQMQPGVLSDAMATVARLRRALERMNLD